MLIHSSLVGIVNRKVPLFLVACGVLWLFALWLPNRVGVLFRDLTADPWRVLWIAAAIGVVVCLDTRHDRVEEALPCRLAGTRAATLRVAALGYIALVAVSALATGHTLADGLGAVIGGGIVGAIVIGATASVGQSAGTTLGFFVVLVSWVFGFDGMTYEPRSWAILLQPPSALLAIAAGIAFLASAGAWTMTGTPNAE